ncbi:hypothetical protein EMIHUDRAFT_194388 [Emiliania huxleyi CCMP1516]|uniref:Uncharacterized protein n=2 Tax=Emiliania huxleyi TaxID=2903 RepID=A0A0D3L1F1_EMIH1|nr:hypothetical protein EMIHUDRAFT_194388 [Emiliania huxleyi CCMP1516]EOD41836.1 hypothetical protein EMIHUDRAFT_194388 [Emiliania huxleyi CCMP1516]|eukprot:XP_005794265.1 hypothetical protein EMIHUDRAFT_194388 [Emiliania huxleyi CCMP1516]
MVVVHADANASAAALPIQMPSSGRPCGIGGDTISLIGGGELGRRSAKQADSGKRFFFAVAGDVENINKQARNARADWATGSEAGEAAAEALAEAAVDAVYGALVAATLEEWAGASTDNPISAADARGPGLECQQCFGSFYDEFGVEPWLWRRALREGWSELGGWSREEMEAAEKEIWRGESSEISQDEEPEPGEGWEGGARPEEYDGLFDDP